MTNVPSVASSALLVELNINVWTGRKLDKSASQDVTRMNSADRGIANVHKKLLGDCAELEAIRKHASQVRGAHYAITMPWSDSGLRLLPTANYFKYNDALGDYQQEFKKLVDAFLAAYEWETSQAQVKLGALFNPDDYPTVQSLKHKFGLSVSFIPLPTSGDWRVDIEADAKRQLETHYQSYYADKLKQAMDDVWGRTADVLDRLSSQLDYGADDKPRGIRDSLMDSAVEIVDLLDACNLTGDPAMRKMANDLRASIKGIGADALRKDAALRRATKRDVDAMIKALPGLGM
jgi:hypothetical protein